MLPDDYVSIFVKLFTDNHKNVAKIGQQDKV